MCLCASLKHIWVWLRWCEGSHGGAISTWLAPQNIKEGRLETDLVSVAQNVVRAALEMFITVALGGSHR